MIYLIHNFYVVSKGKKLFLLLTYEGMSSNIRPLDFIVHPESIEKLDHCIDD